MLDKLLTMWPVSEIDIQTLVMIWGVFEVRMVRFKFDQHLERYHGQKRRKTDGKSDGTSI